MLPSHLLIFDLPRRRDAPPLRMTCRQRLTITLQVRPSDCCCQGAMLGSSHRVEFFMASILSSTWREVEAFSPKVKTRVPQRTTKSLTPSFNAMLCCMKYMIKRSWPTLAKPTFAKVEGSCVQRYWFLEVVWVFEINCFRFCCVC